MSPGLNQSGYSGLTSADIDSIITPTELLWSFLHVKRAGSICCYYWSQGCLSNPSIISSPLLTMLLSSLLFPLVFLLSTVAVYVQYFMDYGSDLETDVG